MSSSWRSVSTCSRPTARMSYSSLNASRQFTSSSWCLLYSPSQHHTRTFPLTHILTRPYPNPLRTLTSFQSSFHPHPTHTLTHPYSPSLLILTHKPHPLYTQVPFQLAWHATDMLNNAAFWRFNYSIDFLQALLLTDSLTRSLARSLTHSFAHSLTHSLTHSPN